MKKLLIAGAAVLVLVVGGVAFLASNLDSIVEKAIERFGSDMTGVSVKVKKVSIALADGRGEIGGLLVANPKGYKEHPHTFSLGTIVLSLDPATVTKDVIVIRELTIEAPDMGYEKGASGNNLEAIQRNVDAYVKANFGGGAAPDKGKKDDNAKETRFIVEKLQIRNGKVRLAGVGVSGKDADVALPALNMSNLGKSKGGATGAEIASIVVKQMTEAAVAAAVRGLAQKGADRAKESVKGRLLGR